MNKKRQKIDSSNVRFNSVELDFEPVTMPYKIRFYRLLNRKSKQSAQSE